MALISPCQLRQDWEELGEGLVCALSLTVLLSLGDTW